MPEEAQIPEDGDSAYHAREPMAVTCEVFETSEVSPEFRDSQVANVGTRRCSYLLEYLRQRGTEHVNGELVELARGYDVDVQPLSELLRYLLH